ncbi:MAG: transglutaminase family protein [Alphaproteobacteria bacterium]|nr:transglutaminase family protein [Alphaproteobacteria bacterium]
MIDKRRLRVTHVTVYRYANPVSFGEHRMMFRPRDSHDLRLIEATLTISPPAAIRWLHDVFGNSVAIAAFGERATELRFESDILLEHFETDAPDYPIAEHARLYPFSYDSGEIPDLSRLIERAYPDPEHAVDRWAKGFLSRTGPTETWSLLTEMTRSVRRDFSYVVRDAEGVQTPAYTLNAKTGTCRDFALLMMEAVRSLGMAARFVSGYLYQSNTGGERNTAGCTTHAWTQVYLPGAGWTEFDPTNGIVGNRDLIRVAVARDPSQAVPLSGSFSGAQSDFLGISVDVAVTAES